MDNVTITRCVLENLIADQRTDFAMNETSYETIKEALKKRIPMKPTFPDCYALHCTICNNIVFDFNVERQDYCSKCGQAIDWSD